MVREEEESSCELKLFFLQLQQRGVLIGPTFLARGRSSLLLAGLGASSRIQRRALHLLDLNLHQQKTCNPVYLGEVQRRFQVFCVKSQFKSYLFE